MANALEDEDLTTTYTTEALSSMWRASPRGETSVLATEWSQQYPMLFDQDDLDLIVNQACDGYHFAEWYAAIHRRVSRWQSLPSGDLSDRQRTCGHPRSMFRPYRSTRRWVANREPLSADAPLGRRRAAARGCFNSPAQPN